MAVLGLHCCWGQLEFWRAGAALQLGCVGFSSRRLLLSGSTGCRHAGFSRCSPVAPERELSSYDPWAELPLGMWNLPGPGTEPVSPGLAGRVFTTRPGVPGAVSYSCLYPQHLAPYWVSEDTNSFSLVWSENTRRINYI